MAGNLYDSWFDDVTLLWKKMKLSFLKLWALIQLIIEVSEQSKAQFSHKEKAVELGQFCHNKPLNFANQPAEFGQVLRWKLCPVDHYSYPTGVKPGYCLHLCLDTDGSPKAVFFNLFTSAEPHASMKVTHGTPFPYGNHMGICESSDVREVEATGCLRTYFPSRAEPPWGRQAGKDDQYEIWPHL